jgi:putative membrane protein
MQNDNIASWLIRLIKGVLIGSGFILPGISGAALAAVFGLYERIIKFLANITKDFKANFFFFLPVGIGGICGVFIFSVFLSYFFKVAEVQLIWFFIGCIVGTLPTLWKQAGQHGRKPLHVIALILCLAAAFAFMIFIDRTVAGSFPQNTYTWLMTGGLIAFSAIIPGLSTANLLLFLQIYAPMTRGIANLDFTVIIPICVGGLVTVSAFARLMVFVFAKAYSTLFHSIIGFVLASTLLIVPIDYSYISLGGLICVVTAILGIVVARWMCQLEDRYK